MRNLYVKGPGSAWPGVCEVDVTGAMYRHYRAWPDSEHGEWVAFPRGMSHLEQLYTRTRVATYD